MLETREKKTFPQPFYEIHSKLEKWVSRFPGHKDPSIFNDLALFYLTVAKTYLDHCNPVHIFRLVLAIHLMQKKLFRAIPFSTIRQIEIKWISTNLLFPFSSKPVLGCLVGINLLDRYELFDEENILLILQKHFPDLKLVKESTYLYPSQKKNLKIFYFEIEKADGSVFSLKEQLLLKGVLEEKIKNSVQRLSPTVFMRRNEEEVCKNILTLSQEIHSTEDMPQAVISLEKHTAGEIVFLVTLVYIAPPQGFSFQKYFTEAWFIYERQVPVKYFGEHLIEAHIFHIRLDRHPTLLRSDGSLDFYLARQKAVSLIHSSIGVFRDFNGGILIKQQECLQLLKEEFSKVDPELLETFFYSITPLESQFSLPHKTLIKLFSYFLEIRKEKRVGRYLCKEDREQGHIFLSVRSNDLGLKDLILEFLKQHSFNEYGLAFSIIQLAEEFFFQSVVVHSSDHEVESFVESFKNVLSSWEEKIIRQKSVRIGVEYNFVSLDPRIGGESNSQVIVGLLFEGLTRYDKEGCIELAIADTIDISSDGLEYIFKLQPSYWNDQSPLTAYDFEYAWKKVLSPDFQTSFAYLFYPIRGAKEAKEGKISPDLIGIEVINELTLKVQLKHPAPYFLELTSHSIYSPIHRLIDQENPQWPYQTGTSFLSNGPFCISMNHPGLAYKLVKNPHYWAEDNIDLDEIIFNKMNSHEAFQAFRKGEIDWLGHPLGAWMMSYSPAVEDQVITFPNCSSGWFVFNTSQWPFHNLKLRQAISHVIDRSAFCDTASPPLTPACSLLLPRHSCSTQISFPVANCEIARKLWEEGWQELGIHKDQIPRLSFIYLHRGIREHVVPYLQAQLREVLNFECDFIALSWEVLFKRMTKGDFQMGLMQWHSWINDPIYTLNSFRFKTEDTNFSKWENSLYQELLEKGDQENDLEIRRSYLAQAEELLCREMPTIPLFHQPFQALIKKNLKISYNVSRSMLNFSRCFYKK